MTTTDHTAVPVAQRLPADHTKSIGSFAEQRHGVRTHFSLINNGDRGVIYMHGKHTEQHAPTLTAELDISLSATGLLDLASDAVHIALALDPHADLTSLRNLLDTHKPSND